MKSLASKKTTKVVFLTLFLVLFYQGNVRADLMQEMNKLSHFLFTPISEVLKDFSCVLKVQNTLSNANGGDIVPLRNGNFIRTNSVRREDEGEYFHIGRGAIFHIKGAHKVPSDSLFKDRYEINLGSGEVLDILTEKMEESVTVGELAEILSDDFSLDCKNK